MKSYLFISKIRIQTALAYRFNVISTILIQCLIMYAMSCFWVAAYSGTDLVSSVSQRDMITYTTISVIMGNLLTMGVQNRIAQSVRLGSAALDMLKPVNIYGIYLAEDLGDIQELCRRVIIINEGKIVEDGSLDELVDKIAPYRHLTLDFYHPTTVQHPHAELVSVNEARAVYRFRKDEITAARLIEDISHTAPIKEVGLEEAKIDDIIRTVYRQGGTAAS